MLRQKNYKPEFKPSELTSIAARLKFFKSVIPRELLIQILTALFVEVIKELTTRIL